MAQTKIIKCNCKHEYQDRVYGKGKRLANKMTGGKTVKKNSWRCTVCGKEHDLGG